MQANKQIIITLCILGLVYICSIIIVFYFLYPRHSHIVIAAIMLLSILFITLTIIIINYFLSSELPVTDTGDKAFLIDTINAPKLAFGHYDKLTSLPNQILFNRILNRALNHAKRHNKLLSVLVIGIDHFNELTKNLRKHKTEQLLKEISARLINILRTDDIIARLDNDEFILLLSDMSHAKFAGPIAEKIIYSSKDPLKIGQKKISITFSIGIAIFPTDSHSLETLLMHAESALYAAKADGGDRYKYHTVEMDILSRKHIELETALRTAIDNHEFVLYFQPQYNLANSTVNSVEALIRWIHPKYGIMDPSQFIPLAEETGLISSIGEWALHEACRINKHWQDLGYPPHTIAVNISIKELQKNLSDIVKNALEVNQLKPEYLEIEITESEIISNPESTLREIIKIHDMGVQIAIDDFGSGYTSINYLRQFPLQTLKIDQSLIKQVEHNQKDQAITKSIIELGHSLGLKVIAEGVESIEQIIFLSTYHCDYAQGYFFSRPLPEHTVVELFAQAKNS